MTVIKSSDDMVAAALAKNIQRHLTVGKKVLWFVSGGSSLPIAHSVINILDSSFGELFITLVDDVYGANSNSNWSKFLKLGFDPEKISCAGILQDGLSPAETTKAFEELVEERMAWADIAFGQFGIGEGYHTGGIQPGSVASREHQRLALSYRDGEITRVTITPGLIEKLDEVYINSFGVAKKVLVEHFIDSNASIESEPTQALKHAKLTYLYTDAV